MTVGSTHYLPSSVFVGELRGNERWDPEGHVWFFAAGPHTLTAAPEIPVVLVDGVPQRLPHAPVMREGILLLPEILWERWAAGWRVTAVPLHPGPRTPALRTIVVDAGHGGHDPGAVGRTGLREKSVTLSIASRLRGLLSQEGFRVIMIRDRDRFVSLSGRSEMANREAGDLFISIHANSARRRNISGYEVYTLSEATDDHARALEAVENASLPASLLSGQSGLPSPVGKESFRQTEAILWDLLYTEHRAESMELAGAVCRGLKKAGIPSPNRGVKSARFAVLKGARMPAILVEVGFLSHPAEEARLRSGSYRQQVAEGIRRGILQFREQYADRS